MYHKNLFQKEGQEKESQIDLIALLKYFAKVEGIRIRSKLLTKYLQQHVRDISRTAHMLGINRVTLAGYLKGISIPIKIALKLIPEVHFHEFDDLQYSAGHGGPTNYVRLPIKLTTKLAYLIGVLRDGYLGITKRNDYLITYTGSNIQWLKKINKQIQQVFGITLKVREDTRKNCYYLERSLKTYAMK